MKDVSTELVLLAEFIRIQRGVIELAVNETPGAAVDMVADYIEEAGVEDPELQRLLDKWRGYRSTRNPEIRP